MPYYRSTVAILVLCSAADGDAVLVVVQHCSSSAAVLVVWYCTSNTQRLAIASVEVLHWSGQTREPYPNAALP
eukprot:5134367-Pyramimonas_sp.AAC.1